MRINEEKKRRPIGSTGEAQLLLSALSKVQHFGNFQQPVQGIKDVHLPAPDSISTSFDEPLSDEGDVRGVWSEIDAAERRSSRRRKWILAFVAAGVIVIVLFILFTLFWLDNYIERHDGEFYPIAHLTKEQLLEIEEQQKWEGTYPTILPDK